MLPISVDEIVTVRSIKIHNCTVQAPSCAYLEENPSICSGPSFLVNIK